MGDVPWPASASPGAFGGYKQSGLGREWGRHGLEDFTEIKYAQLELVVATREPLMAGPLGDVRVLDLTVAARGPMCVRQLADWGADVVRVEPPADPTTTSGIGQARHGSDFQHSHRNKRSLSLDLKQAAGQELLLRLVDTADVLVENMRPPVKARLGFPWEVVHRRNPRLVYASLSGYGQDGPYAERGGLDQVVQGMAGLMSVTGHPGEGPLRTGIAISDLSAGLFLAIGILVALHERDRTGTGRLVETSLLESMIAMLDFQAVRWTNDREVPHAEGNHHPTFVPMGCFPTSDGWVNVSGPSGRMLERLCDTLGLAGLPSDPRFDSVAKRSANRVELNALIAERLATATTAEWVDRLDAADVPCGPVYTMDEVFADPQVQHLGMVRDVEHPALGTLSIVRSPVGMGDDHETVRTAAPEPGEHTDEVLHELGLGHDEIADLRELGVV